MSRRTRGKQPGISLFPFLAVLVCTMGSLIVLLVIVVQQARAGVEESAADAARQASQQAAQEQAAASQQDRLQQEREGLLWKVDVLKQAREEKIEALEQQRGRLSHLEAHIRELEARWRALTEQARAMQELQTGAAPQAAQEDAELAALRQAIQVAAEELDQLKAKAQEPGSFAIIPYRGPNGTRRRPIYLECTAQGVVLRPEGVTFGAADFAGLLGPGNPLDAALRAIRTYWLENGLIESEREPYPLLIVRPSGIVAYGLGRAALEHWDDAFGYELVSEDLPLAYPPPDPQLAEAVRSAIRDARQRQIALAKAMPRAFNDVARQLAAQAAQGGGGGGADGLAGGTGFGGADSSDASSANSAFDGRDATDPSEAAAGQADGSQAGGPNQSGPNQGGAAGGSVGSASLMGNPMANSRGANWAIEAPRGNPTSWNRPVGLTLTATEMRIASEDAGQPPQVVSFAGGEVAALESLSNAIKQRVRSWGLPPTGGYWKPTLSVRVAPAPKNAFNGCKFCCIAQDSNWKGSDVSRHRRRCASSTEAPGQDSFLDIVANLVGILIILVMVVGARARQALQQVAESPAVAEIARDVVDLAGPQSAVQGMEGNIADLTRKISRQDAEIAYREEERNRLNVLIVAAEQSLESRREELNQQQRDELQKRQAVAAEQRRLQQLRQQQAALAQQNAPQVIDHLPTPIAKTVFGRELHFRLAGGRVSYVPFDEFVDLLKTDAQRKIELLRSAPSFTESVGPIGDFQMRYVMKRSQRAVETPAGKTVQELAELDYFELIPLQEAIGEPINVALRDGSDFLGRIQHEDPRATTVTVWVYADGFDQYRLLKQRLTDLGYLSAARPLPPGQLIGGSPSGRRSAAQ